MNTEPNLTQNVTAPDGTSRVVTAPDGTSRVVTAPDGTSRVIRAALYARVSSEGQREEATIESQIDALRRRIAQDGLVLTEDMCFIDNGYSASTLIRPGLERLRDAAAFGRVDRVYAHAPDRLSRDYADLIVLAREWQQLGVELSFVNGNIDDTPEAKVLLQVQGIMAEYERAKIKERTRRGTRYAAHQGRLSVLGGAPYGYRYIRRRDGEGEARYEVVLEQARRVRDMFTWVAQDRLSLGDVRRRLAQQGVPSPTGLAWWDRATIRDLLRNPAYCGRAAFGRTRAGPRRARLRVMRGVPEVPRRWVSIYNVPAEEWIQLAVPAIVSEALFQAVAEQLTENRARARCQKDSGRQHLLAGLMVCGTCRRGMSAKTVGVRKTDAADQTYYVCNGRYQANVNHDDVCQNPSIAAGQVEQTVWTDVGQLLKEPARLEQEYRRRLDDQKAGRLPDDDYPLSKQIQHAEQRVSRLIDAWTEGLVTKEEFESRLKHHRQRLAGLQAEAQAAADDESQHRQLRLAVVQLEDFGKRVQAGLEHTDRLQQREIIRKLVKRVEVSPDKIKIIYRIDAAPYTMPDVPSPPPRPTSHCCASEATPPVSVPQFVLDPDRGRSSGMSRGRSNQQEQNVEREFGDTIGVR